MVMPVVVDRTIGVIVPVGQWQQMINGTVGCILHASSSGIDAGFGASQEVVALLRTCRRPSREAHRNAEQSRPSNSHGSSSRYASHVCATSVATIPSRFF